MKKLRFASEAEADLLEIWVYLYEHSTERADRVMSDLNIQFKMLQNFPESGRIRKDIGPNYRSFPVGNYMIYYHVTEERILIGRVLHASRDVSRQNFPQPLSPDDSGPSEPLNGASER